jgi:hypothetical protein
VAAREQTWVISRRFPWPNPVLHSQDRPQSTSWTVCATTLRFLFNLE